MDEMNYQPTENIVVENDNLVLQLFKRAFSHPLFFAITILMTISAGAGLVSGGINVFCIIYTISFWLLYYSAKNDNVMSIMGMKLFNGTLKAKNIVLWVVIGILAVCGVLCMFVFPILSGPVSEIINNFVDLGDSVHFMPGYTDVTGNFSVIFGIIIGFVFLVLAVIFALVNIFYLNKALAFTKSLYNSGNSGVFGFANAKYVAIWILVMGIISAVSIDSRNLNLLSVASQLTNAAAYIIGYFWINKALLSE